MSTTTRARTRAATAAAAAAAAAATATPTPESTNPVLSSTTPPTSAKPKSTPRKTPAKQQRVTLDSHTPTDPSSEKENLKSTIPKSTTKTPSTKSQPQPQFTPTSNSTSKPAPKQIQPSSLYCTCTRGDDGSPMIHCPECKNWYHFICVDLSEHEAEEINVYICPTCTKSTGRKSAMTWEGMDALEDCGPTSDLEATPIKTIFTVSAKAASTTPATISSKTTQKSKPTRKSSGNVSTQPKRVGQRHQPQLQLPLSDGSEDGDDSGSEDNYVDEDEEEKERVKIVKGKRRLRRLSSPSASSSTSSPPSPTQHHPSSTSTKRRPKKLRKLSTTTPIITQSRSQTPTSPVTPSTPTISRLKRKSSIIETGQQQQQPLATKRKRSDTNTGGGGDEDPVRKYCLGKLEEVFRDVFIRYPYVRIGEVKVEGGVHEGEEQTGMASKKYEEMTDEEKELLINDSKRFAVELEQCVFEIYSEPDKIGAPHAGAKYKDRFRMLQFNLSKPDRVIIHQRIITRTITPKEISLMSSTDLADEETKQHIKIAEKESLEQTILQKPVVPRAKITHKGLQDIEDVNGELALARAREIEREREEAEEERRERERRERLKEKQQQQRQRTQSLSLPPESPTILSPGQTMGQSPVMASWGAPPPVPAHVLQQHQQQQDDILNPSIRPLFTHTISDVVMTPEPELNLADLINIDEDGTEQDGDGAGPTITATGTVSTTGTGPETSAGTGIGAADSAISSSSSLAPLPLPGPSPAPLDHQPIEPDLDKPSSNSAPSSSITGLGHFSVSPTSPTAPSPFSPNRPRGLSFDLNSLWQSAPTAMGTGTEKEGDNVVHDHGQADEPYISPTTSQSPSLPNTGGGDPGLLEDGNNNINIITKDGSRTERDESTVGGGIKDLMMEPEPMGAVTVANDDDFDMFLAEEKDEVVVASSSNGSQAGGNNVLTGGGGPSTIPAAPVPTEVDKPPVVSQDPEVAFEMTPRCWTGKIHMPLDSAAPQTTTVFARQIGGRSLGYQSSWWKTLFPSEELRIDGRVPTKNSSDFLTQVRLNPNRELIAVAFTPVEEGMKKDFVALADYLKSRDRHGLIFPWGQRTKDWAPGRELYLSPLLANEPLPEYIELLDELKLPRTRKSDYMIGIWILVRGKLDNAPPQLPPSTTPTTPGIASSVLQATPVTPVVPPTTIPNIPPLPPHLAAATSLAASTGTSALPSGVISPPQSGVPAQVNASALAAEVASLTPEQVQNLMRTLSASNIPFPVNLTTSAAGQAVLSAAQSLSLPGQPPRASHPPMPPQWPGYPLPPVPPPTLSQPPQSGYPPPPGMYGLPPLPSSHSHSHPPPPSHHGSPDRDRRDSYPSHGHHAGGRGGDRDRDRDRGERGGWRGGGGRDGRHPHRGRGKHRGGGGGSGSGGGGGGGGNRPVDSGWPRRSRNEDGNGSPSRRW